MCASLRLTRSKILPMFGNKKFMKPKKSLGQNFLISPRVSNMIARAGDIVVSENVVEIGPGKGALTKELLAFGAQVIAIEKDNELISALEEKFAKEISEKQLEIISGDVLEMDFEKLEIGNWKLIANIPYYITGAIIEKFLSSKNPPSLAVLMLQKEVAERIIARNLPRRQAGKKESILSISVKVFGAPTIVMKVSRGNFFPIPNVDSAVLKISNIKNPFKTKEEEEKFFTLVKKGFAHKRKKLIGNLESEDKEKIRRAFSEIGISENARAEDLFLENWKILAKKLEN